MTDALLPIVVVGTVLIGLVVDLIVAPLPWLTAMQRRRRVRKEYGRAGGSSDATGSEKWLTRPPRKAISLAHKNSRRKGPSVAVPQRGGTQCRDSRSPMAALTSLHRRDARPYVLVHHIRAAPGR